MKSFISKKNTLPLVSVIVRTFANRKIHLLKSLDSILRQTMYDFEIIVVEDGGSNYNEVIERLGDDRIKYFGLPKVGRCVTGNFGLSIAKGKYINFLDDDDYLYKNHFELLVEALKFSEGSLAVYSASHMIKSQMLFNNEGDVVEIIESKKKVKFLNKFNRIALLTVNLFPIQSVMFDRKLYELHGGFSSSLVNLEDWDLWVKYSQTSDFKLVDEVTSVFRLPEKSKTSLNRTNEIISYHNKALSGFSKYSCQSFSYFEAHNAIKKFIIPQLAV